MVWACTVRLFVRRLATFAVRRHASPIQVAYVIAVEQTFSNNLVNCCEVLCQNVGIARLPSYFLLFRAPLKLYSVLMTNAKVMQKGFPGPVVYKWQFLLPLFQYSGYQELHSICHILVTQRETFADYRLIRVTIVSSSLEVSAVRCDRTSSLCTSLNCTLLCHFSHSCRVIRNLEAGDGLSVQQYHVRSQTIVYTVLFISEFEIGRNFVGLPLLPSIGFIFDGFDNSVRLKSMKY